MPRVTRAASAAVLRMVSRDLTLRLFANDVAPGEGDTLATYREVSGGGYRPVPVPPGAWTITASGARATEQVFRFTGPAGLVHGWYLQFGDTVLAAGRLTDVAGGPPLIRVAGDEVAITPRLEWAA